MDAVTILGPTLTALARATEPHGAVNDFSHETSIRIARMLRWALTFFILALLAAFLGFFAMAGLAAEIAKLLLIAFVVLLAISLITGRTRGSPPA
jgi:uncharacterized membrane protein YtjA (UPF0391 family)